MNESETKLHDLQRRIGRLPLGLRELGIEREWKGLQDSLAYEDFFDEDLFQAIETRVAEVEHEQVLDPFSEPPAGSYLERGSLHILNTLPSRRPVRVDFDESKRDSLDHVVTVGLTRSGKSSFIARLLIVAASICSSLAIDPNRFFRRITELRRSHHFLRGEALRLNFFDCTNVPLNQQDEAQIFELCSSYPLQFARYVISLTGQAFRANGKPFNWPEIAEHLARASFPGTPRMKDYANSGALVIGNLVAATPVFDCLKGMNLLELCSNNLVVELDGLPDHSAYLTRAIFEQLRLAASHGFHFGREFLFVLDEGQVISQQQNFSEKNLRLRHARIHLISGFQNCSKVPIEMLGNASALIGFQMTDRQDRERFASAASLTPQQSLALGTLQSGQCVAFIPRLWPRPFLAEVPEVSWSSPPPNYEEQGREFLSRFTWEPRIVAQAASEAPDPRDKAFLNDVYSIEFDKLANRFMRLGIPSTAQQRDILHRLQDAGLIKIKHVVDTTGRLALVELLPSAYSIIDRSPQKKPGIGAGIDHRFYCVGLKNRNDAIDGRKTRLEVELNEHIVDLVVEDTFGRITTHDIKVTTTVEHELAAVVKLFSGSTAIHKHYIVCGTKQDTAKSAKAVKKHLIETLFDKGIDNEKIIVIQFAKLASELERVKGD